MFQITLAEHVRLSFGSALAAYEGHAQAAATLARRSSYARLALLGISGLAAIAGSVAVPGGYGWQLTSAILSVAVFNDCVDNCAAASSCGITERVSCAELSLAARTSSTKWMKLSIGDLYERGLS